MKNRVIVPKFLGDSCPEGMHFSSCLGMCIFDFDLDSDQKCIEDRYKKDQPVTPVTHSCPADQFWSDELQGCFCLDSNKLVSNGVCIRPCPEGQFWSPDLGDCFCNDTSLMVKNGVCVPPSPQDNPPPTPPKPTPPKPSPVQVKAPPVVVTTKPPSSALPTYTATQWLTWGGLTAGGGLVAHYAAKDSPHKHSLLY